MARFESDAMNSEMEMDELYYDREDLGDAFEEEEEDLHAEAESDDDDSMFEDEVPSSPRRDLYARSARSEETFGDEDDEFPIEEDDDEDDEDDDEDYGAQPAHREESGVVPPNKPRRRCDDLKATVEENFSTESAPTVSDFKVIRVIGKGSFGKVFLVRQRNTKMIYAMKVLKKDNIVKRNQVEHTKTEWSVLGYVRHPFVVGLRSAFQTAEKLYFVLDYCAGGELFCHLQKLGKFSEKRARFYTAELTLALEHVHSLGVVYRDLKPENVLLDARGHVRLTDFGLSKERVTHYQKGASSFCGTPEYLAPEILARRGHGRAVDWWSLGALLYEMLTGLPPFYSRDREQLFEGIKRGHLAYPRYVSVDAKSLLKSLLHREPAARLGSGPTDALEVKKHVFFKHINFDALIDGTVVPPYQPDVTGSLDTSQFDREFTSLPIHSPPTHNASLAATVTVSSSSSASDTTTYREQTFAGFTYVSPSNIAVRSTGP